MNKTLLITAVFGWLAFSQTAHAHDRAPTEAPMPPQQEASQQGVTAPPARLHMAQITDPAATPLPARERAADSNRGGMPSVPVGLAGLFVMLCVLVRRRNA